MVNGNIVNDPEQLLDEWVSYIAFQTAEASMILRTPMFAKVLEFFILGRLAAVFSDVGVPILTRLPTERRCPVLMLSLPHRRS